MQKRVFYMLDQNTNRAIFPFPFVDLFMLVMQTDEFSGSVIRCSVTGFERVSREIKSSFGILRRYFV